ncbi:hypothetical protein M5K25_007507 [Dendrobium thyrsiflorum]|uniref:Uncharacterized protein n=1 Tax=Dendrobium thyrsiflorum TaxID=117978 RepID=A0ABD0VFH0_DENTH
MGDPFALVEPIPSFCRMESFMRTYQDFDHAIRRDDELYLRRHLNKLAEKKAEILSRSQKLEERYYAMELEKHYYAVNLSGDPLLSVLISYEKTELAKKLLRYMDDESLLEANLQGNTALHVAAAVGDKVIEIAKYLIYKNELLLEMRNENNETPLLRAALYGQRKFFWMLYNFDKDGSLIENNKDGASVLHYAIMGNAPREFPS